MEIEQLLSRPEGKTLEFKRDLSGTRGILKTIVALANTAGGRLVIGVSDRKRDVVGIDDPLTQEERLTSLISDGIAPQLAPEIEICRWKDRHVIAVEVFPGPARPYYLIAKGRESGVFIRVGSTNRAASAEMIAELERANTNASFDEQLLTTLDASQIDFELASRVFAKRVLRRSDLRTLRITGFYGKREVPTIGGLLLFGKSRLDHFPDARIKIASFGGTDRSSLLDMSEIETALPLAVGEVLDHVERFTRVGYDFTRGARQARSSYPLAATREAVVNAIVHADYSQTGSPTRVAIFKDRMEVTNPGLLPFGLTLEDIRHGVSKLRNRVIGRVFHELGMIEQWGSGVQRMISTCKAQGLAEPKFEEIGTHFRVTFYREKVAPGRTLEAREAQIYDLLSTGNAASSSRIAQEIGVSVRTARKHLKALVDRDLIVKISSSKTDPTSVYRVIREVES